MKTRMKVASPSVRTASSLHVRATALLLTLGAAGALHAQGAGGLSLSLSDGIVPLTQDLTPRNPYFLAVTQCAPAFQGSWCAPYAFAYDEYAAPGTPWSLGFESIDDHNGCGTNTGFLLPAEPASLTDFFEACLTDPQTGQQTPNEVLNWMDHQFDGMPYQLYGWNPGALWERDDLGLFGLSEIAQEAIWNRAQHMPAYAGMTAQQFFESEDYWLLTQFGIKIAITLIGLRGPLVTGGGEFPVAEQGLDGFPGFMPSFDISPQALITFGGPGSAGQPLMFFNPVNPRTGNLRQPVRPIHFVPKGAEFVHPVEGWERGMQIRLVNNSDGSACACDMAWAGFGKMRIQVPATASTGLSSFRKYRYQVGVANNEPVYGPWYTIQSAYRPLLMVQ